MKIKLLSCLLVFLLALPVLGAPPKGKSAPPSALSVDNSTFIDANRILMFVTNHGNFGRDLAGVFGYDYGTWYPYAGDTAAIQNNVDYAGDHSPYYAGGTWIGAVDSATGETRVIISEYSDEYVPGPMLGGTFMEDRPEFRVYKLYRDSLAANPNLDYLEWPEDQGAPVDEEGNPAMIGDRMCWAVFNDANPDQHDNDAGSTNPLGIEVRQTTFAFQREDPLGDIVFLKLQIFNKGENVLQNCYFSIWSDPDLGSAGDDLVGCDTLLSLGFVYNDNNNDSQYSDEFSPAVPSLGIDFFQGPLIETGNPEDTAKMWGQKYPGYLNMGMTSFNKYINGTDPNNFGETYNYMRGLDASGAPYTYLGQVLRFVHTGDPVTGSGDLDIAPADRRWMQSTGPVTFRPGDSTEILAAIVVGQGADRFSSIMVMKYFDKFAQSAYDIDFDIPSPPRAPELTARAYDGYVVIEWTDTSEVDHGDFAFEGYSVYQGVSSAGPWTRLANYDVINGEAVILDEVLDPQTGVLEQKAVKFGSDNGIRHHYKTDQDRINGGELKNLTTYFYKVEAYSYDKEATPKTLTSATTAVLTPQAPVLGTVYPNTSGDEYDVTHATAEGAHTSDGFVTPMVVHPADLLGHDYKVTFTTYQPDTILDIYCWQDTTFQYDTLTDTCDIYWDTTTDIWTAVLCVDTIITDLDPPEPACETLIIIPDVTFWTLTDLTADTVLLDSMMNQSGDTEYEIIDGMLVVVAGPNAGVADYAIPTGTRRWTWSGANWGFEGFNGAIGWGGPGDLNTYGTHAPIPPPQHVTVRLDLAQVLIDTAAYFHCDLLTEDQEACSLYVELDSAFVDSVLASTPETPADTVTYDSVLLLVDSVYTIAVYDVDDPNMSYGYRYLRSPGPPAQPSFAPYIVDPDPPGGSYGFQDFEKSVPLSAWNVDVDPPQRLAVGFLENNQPQGRVDGFYFPGSYLAYDNVATTGPREWLWIYLDDYSETPNPDYELNAINDYMPILYFGTFNRRGDVPYSPGGTGTDQFLIIPAYVNTPADTFFFASVEPVTASTGVESQLDAIKAVPNPFYLFGPYDAAIGSYKVKFHHLPERCTISIYNLAGELVRTVEKNDLTATAEWDVLTEQGLPVSSGIYIYVVDAPGFGTKIGKMAVFVEQEVLRLY